MRLPCHLAQSSKREVGLGMGLDSDKQGEMKEGEVPQETWIELGKRTYGEIKYFIQRDY